MHNISLEQAIIDFPNDDIEMLKEFYCTESEIEQANIDRETGRKNRGEVNLD